MNFLFLPAHNLIFFERENVWQNFHQYLHSYPSTPLPPPSPSKNCKYMRPILVKEQMLKDYPELFLYNPFVLKLYWEHISGVSGCAWRGTYPPPSRCITNNLLAIHNFTGFGNLLFQKVNISFVLILYCLVFVEIEENSVNEKCKGWTVSRINQDK